MGLKNVSRLLIFSSLLLSVSAGQVPKINGIYGGILQDVGVHHGLGAVDAVLSPAVAGPVVTGKMRYIENSGVCGTLFRLLHSAM